LFVSSVIYFTTPHHLVTSRNIEGDMLR